jgi:hypothetical protein
VHQREWFAWMRLFDFSVSPVNATTGAVNANPSSDRISLENSIGGTRIVSLISR